MRRPRVTIWVVLYGILILYVTWRMQGFSLWQLVETPQGLQLLPNTFASVDHPFHVARSEILWRELGAGHVLRWIGQHQAGYPAEFYPLGEAWFEVVIRAASLNSLSPEGSHTAGVIALFLLPGVAFLSLSRVDGFPPPVALLATALQVALPGGWYGGGYTELVQWGLITNVAGATATFLALPSMISAISRDSERAFVLASGLSALALYCNPRSAIGLVAIGVGAVVASVLTLESGPPKTAIQRLMIIAVVTALLAAPLLMSLGRYGDLYSFVHYSEYASLTEYLKSSRDSISAPVLTLGLFGLLAGLIRGRIGTRAAAASAAIFILMTLAVAFAPGVDAILPQLEPTRLMPLQRFLLLYLAAGLTWTVVSSGAARFAKASSQISAGVLLAVSLLLLVFLTRPMFKDPPDPASSDVPPVSLYPVAMSAEPQQASLETAVRNADSEGELSTAILVLGSELSWHQQLWSPLWTKRPIFYDNWLWYWHVDHAGTPGYHPRSGHHYPDPEATLTRDFLDQHGIGAVVTSSAFRRFAERAPFLSQIADGSYSTFLVDDPILLVTFDKGEATIAKAGNSEIEAQSTQDWRHAEVRVNWFPRWTLQNVSTGHLERAEDGTMRVIATNGAAGLTLEYAVQPADWLARFMAGTGLIAIVAIGLKLGRRKQVSLPANTSLRGEA